jgi:hypothetical protein
VATPASGGGLTGVAARSATDVWAVGSITDPAGTTGATGATTTLHWDGTAWSRVANPSGDSILRAVSATPGGGDLWAVGVGNGTLILRNTP